MTPAPVNFDRVARGYRALEFLAFGRDLERARFAFLDELAGCRSLLVLGEGDGRCLARLVRAAPHATITCVDSSAAMLARAQARLAGDPARARVSFIHADALAFPIAPAAYDGLVTLFFLDCFDAATAASLVPRLAHSLRPSARWLYADFALPPRGFARLRARVWLAGLYTFFRWRTGLHTRALPPAEALIRAAGFAPAAALTLQCGLLRSVLFRRDATGTTVTAVSTAVT